MNTQTSLRALFEAIQDIQVLRCGIVTLQWHSTKRSHVLHKNADQHRGHWWQVCAWDLSTQKCSTQTRWQKGRHLLLTHASTDRSSLPNNAESHVALERALTTHVDNFASEVRRRGCWRHIDILNDPVLQKHDDKREVLVMTEACKDRTYLPYDAESHMGRVITWHLL